MALLWRSARGADLRGSLDCLVPREPPIWHHLAGSAGTVRFIYRCNLEPEAVSTSTFRDHPLSVTQLDVMARFPSEMA